MQNFTFSKLGNFRPNFILVGDSNIPFLFVVPPLDLRCEAGQEVETINIIDVGEVTNVGNRKLERIIFSTFLPFPTSNFYSLANPLPPSEGVRLLTKWKDEKEKLTLIIPEFNVYFKCHLERINWEIKERTGDIDVYISLVEQKKNKNLIREVIGLFER